MTNSANGELIFKELLGKIIIMTLLHLGNGRYTPYDLHCNKSTMPNSHLARLRIFLVNSRLRFRNFIFNGK
jgi:hypothetical protein